MSNVRRTAMGKTIDIDALRLSNEKVIALGNTKTNARGDELGKGGEVVKTRGQLMQEYHKLNSPVAAHNVEDEPPTRPTGKLKTPVAADEATLAPSEPVDPSSTYVKPRGSFAEAIAGETEITQELLEPKSITGNAPGVKRI
jgi:hypothetical protein